MSERERLGVVILHMIDSERSLRVYRELLGVMLERGLNVPKDEAVNQVNATRRSRRMSASASRG
jgi:hypothetical protein